MSVFGLKFKLWHFSLITVLFCTTTVFLFDRWARYQSWSHLSKFKIVAEADDFIRERAPNGEGEACFYYVICEGGRPKMELMTSLEDWNLRETKKLVWNRKFKKTCQGRTANFGLELLEKPQSDTKHLMYNKRAVWSFYNDRFIPQWGRFHAYAFSEVDHRPCSAEYVLSAFTQ
jgi:hypothetical protein